MSVFKLPMGLCKDIEAMIRKFWWSNGDAKKIHWVKWNSLCSSKSIGSMGFWDFQKFNNALLAKQFILDVLMLGKVFYKLMGLLRKGQYEGVKSAYRMLVSAEALLMLSSSSSNINGLVWKKIWKIWTLNKIRHFIWRAAKDSLPTKQNLQARHLPISQVCDGCGDHTEMTLHRLWLCDQARSVWMSISEFRSLVQKNCQAFFELLEELFSGGSSFQIALFATVAWCLWQRRNRMRERQPVWLLHELGARARELVIEYGDVNCQEHRVPIPRPRVCWFPPLVDSYKANFDAAFSKESRFAAIVVYRDHTGQVITALC
nr:uncharacterized protein LOC112018299 [Quercus suber]